MAIKLKVTITNKWLYSLMGVSFLLALGIGVWAYGSGQPPSVFGHSGEEIEVTVNGETKLLNDALNQVGGGIVVSNEVRCATSGMTWAATFGAWRYCNLGPMSEWKTCFLTRHNPTTSSGSWDAGCGINHTASGMWRLGVYAVSGDGLECRAQCIK